MSRGSWIFDDVVRHFESCAQCLPVRPDDVRVAQPASLRHVVPDSVLAALCPDGRAFYRAYLRWLAEPDE